MNEEDKEDIVESARRALPFTTEIKANTYVVPVPRKKENYILFSDVLSLPFYHTVTFKKQIINGVIIGWELVSID